MDTLQPYFDQLGFSENETLVFLTLAEVGKSPASLLAKRIGIPRTTVYSVLDSLQERGVVSVEQVGATTFYAPRQPAALLRMLSKDKEELIKRETAAKSLIELIKPFYKSKHFSIPKIEFFEGSKAVESMLYDHFSQWQESIAKFDYTWWGYQDHTFVEKYLKYLEFTWKRFHPNERIKLISNAAPVESSLKGKVAQREIRYIEKGLNFSISSSIWVVGDYIVMIMTSQEPHYAFMLKDAVFASNLRSLFQILWNYAKP